MSGFVLTKRGDLPNFYVCFKNPLTGKYGTKRSTGTSDRKLAEKIAYQWLFEESKKDTNNLVTVNLTAPTAARKSIVLFAPENMNRSKA